jgi:hypothetical protein
MTLKNNKKKVFCFDAETDGLWGEAFAIGAVVYCEGKLVDTFLERSAETPKNPWTIKNVLPEIESIKPTLKNYWELLVAFSKFYHKHKFNNQFVVHLGYIVEAKILRDMHEYLLISDLGAPYPLIDISGNLQAAGEDPKSVDTYLEKHDLKPNIEAKPRSPLYYADATATAYMELTKHLK